MTDRPPTVRNLNGILLDWDRALVMRRAIIIVGGLIFTFCCLTILTLSSCTLSG